MLQLIFSLGLIEASVSFNVCVFFFFFSNFLMNVNLFNFYLGYEIIVLRVVIEKFVSFSDTEKCTNFK